MFALTLVVTAVFAGEPLARDAAAEPLAAFWPMPIALRGEGSDAHLYDPQGEPLPTADALDLIGRPDLAERYASRRYSYVPIGGLVPRSEIRAAVAAHNARWARETPPPLVLGTDGIVTTEGRPVGVPELAARFGEPDVERRLQTQHGAGIACGQGLLFGGIGLIGISVLEFALRGRDPTTADYGRLDAQLATGISLGAAFAVVGGGVLGASYDARRPVRHWTFLDLDDRVEDWNRAHAHGP